MIILGIETSCDETSVAVVEDGKKVLSNIIATQIDLHREYYGVVPEIASRLHTEWISSVTDRALEEAGLTLKDIDGIAVTSMPGLIGSLLVGLSFAKGLSYSLSVPYVSVDHIKAHLYAPHLENDISYPYLGLLVSGGHTMIARVSDYNTMEVLGTTIDDACGEAFDKIAKHYDWGYPGGVVIDRMSKEGDSKAFPFPKPNLYKSGRKYDVSYSGLKTAVINQINQFNPDNRELIPEDIAASFQKTAVDLLVAKLKKVVKDTGITTVVAGGGVTANSYMREVVQGMDGVTSYFPSLRLCADNGAMIAGLGYHLFKEGQQGDYSDTVKARVINAGSKKADR